MGTKKSFSALKMAYISLGAVLIALCSWISVPATVPFTLQTFAVLLVCDLLGGRWGLVSVLLYLLLGAVGLPVFAGFKGGLGSLMGVTGGYLLGFVFSALAVGLITKFFGRSFPVLIVSMVLGLVLCYAFGSAWFQILYIRTKGAITTGAVLSACVIPYLIPDAIKIALAAVLGRRLQPHISLAKA